MVSTVASPLEPLPFSDLPPIELSAPLRPAAYRRRSTAALAMLLAISSGSSEETKSQDELRCRYPSKVCRNERVRKASGALHRYCAYHRDRANANQKRWVDRQRHETTVAGNAASASSSSSRSSSPLSSPASSASSSPTSVSLCWAAATPTVEPSASAATLSDDEWDELLSLLDTPSPRPTPPKPQPPIEPRPRRLAAACRRWCPLGPFN